MLTTPVALLEGMQSFTYLLPDIMHVTGPQMEQALISYAGVSDLGIDLRKDIVQQRQTLEAEVRQSQVKL